MAFRLIKVEGEIIMEDSISCMTGTVNPFGAKVTVRSRMHGQTDEDCQKVIEQMERYLQYQLRNDINFLNNLPTIDIK